MMQSTGRTPVAILGATGLVGQRLISLLSRHPFFEVAELAASSRSAGKPYGEAVNWQMAEELPAALAKLPIHPCDPSHCRSGLVFSALDRSVALEIEQAFAQAGRAVVTNAAPWRMEADLPLIVPEINADHLDLIERQRKQRGWPGFIVTNPNCSTIGLSLAIAPIQIAAGVDQLIVTTLQAASGAGYPGVPTLDLLDNVVPYIPGEEEKIETETKKIFGSLIGEQVEAATFLAAAQVHRVPVVDGHLMSISVKTRQPLDPLEAIDRLRSFRAPREVAELPSAPVPPILVRGEEDRPQPRLDRGAGNGMAVSLGRVRSCPILGLRMEALSHNTIRGAAGGTLLIAELLHSRSLLP